MTHRTRIRHKNDEPLKQATKRLHTAIDALIAPRWETITTDTRTRYVRIASRYTELQNATKTNSGGHTHRWQSTVPLWLDATELILKIDQTVAQIHPPPRDWHGWTIPRLQALTERRWRPQDTPTINTNAARLEELATRADLLFAPSPRYLPDPCPACSTTVVHREQDGERIRQPALRITTDGATCQHCRTRWAPEQLKHLGRVLGYTETA